MDEVVGSVREEFYEMANGERPGSLKPGAKDKAHRDMRSDAWEAPGVVSWFLSQGAYVPPEHVMPALQRLRSFVRTGYYPHSFGYELDDEDRAALVTEIKRMERSLVQAGVLTCAEQRPRRTRCLSPSPQLAYYWPGRKACMLRRSTRCH
jgi:hypothetical protein